MAPGLATATASAVAESLELWLVQVLDFAVIRPVQKPGLR